MSQTNNLSPFLPQDGRPNTLSTWEDIRSVVATKSTPAATPASPLIITLSRPTSYSGHPISQPPSAHLLPQHLHRHHFTSSFPDPIFLLHHRDTCPAPHPPPTTPLPHPIIPPPSSASSSTLHLHFTPPTGVIPGELERRSSLSQRRFTPPIPERHEGWMVWRFFPPVYRGAAQGRPTEIRSQQCAFYLWPAASTAAKVPPLPAFPGNLFSFNLFVFFFVILHTNKQHLL